MLTVRTLVASSAIAAMIIGGWQASGAQFFVVEAVGLLPNEPGPTWAWDINDAGEVFGMAHVNGSRESRCFLFNTGKHTTFAADQGHPFIWAGAVNNTTTFVGTQMVTVPVGKRESFIGGLEFLPELFPQFPYADASYGRDINNSGPPWGTGTQRLSPTIGTGGFSTFRAYLVLLDGNPNPPIALSALGGTFVRGEALNDSRDVVGASLTTSGPLRAFFRPGTGGASVNLGTLGGSHSWATDVNNAQQVVGWSRMPDGGTRAFLYQNSTMTDLGTLGGHISEARGINEAGWIVGMAFNAQAKQRAFLHDGDAMINLNERIAADSGWILQTARAINESGAIVGWGRFQDETQGFVLTPRGPGDVNLDGTVDVDDLFALIGLWGPCPDCPADLDDDGDADIDDLFIVLGAWS